MGYFRGSKWTDEEISILEKHYADTYKDDLMVLLPKRSWLTIQQRAGIIGVQREKAWCQTRGCRNEVRVVTAKCDDCLVFQDLEHRLKWQYQTTLDWYFETLESQGWACALCFEFFDSETSVPYVDHDHSCLEGHVVTRGCPKCNRGLLCRWCNLVLGYFEKLPNQAQAVFISNMLNYLHLEDLANSEE